MVGPSEWEVGCPWLRRWVWWLSLSLADLEGAEPASTGFSRMLREQGDFKPVGILLPPEFLFDPLSPALEDEPDVQSF